MFLVQVFVTGFAGRACMSYWRKKTRRLWRTGGVEVVRVPRKRITAEASGENQN
jgi:hypothetical protein